MDKNQNQNSSAIKTCKNCGVPLDPETRFCVNCGILLSRSKSNRSRNLHKCKKSKRHK